MTTFLNTTSTLVQQYQNTAVSEDKREIISENLDSMVNTLIDIGNTNYSGRYIFGGFNVNEKPFIIEGDKIRFRGSDDVLSTEIFDNEYMDVSIAGNDVFITHSIIGNA